MEQVTLPLETRQCPQCMAATFKARRAGRGGSWGGQGLHYLYQCNDCGYSALVESVPSRDNEVLSGIILTAIGALMFFILDAPGNGIVAMLLIALGAFAIWHGRFDLEQRAPVVEVFQGEEQLVPIENVLFASDEEAVVNAVRNLKTSYIIYGIAALTLFYCLFELIGWL